MKLTLLSKGLLLVSIPLCFEITIFVVLLNLQDQVETEARRIDHNNRINNTVNSVIRSGVMISDWMNLNSNKPMDDSSSENSSSATELITPALKKKSLGGYFAEVRREFKELRELTKDDPDLLAHVETCQKGADMACQDIVDFKKKLKNTNYADLGATVLTLRKKLDSDLDITFRGDLLGLANRSHKSIDDAPSQHIRDQIKVYLKAALCLSAMLAVVGTTLLSRHLVGRLTQLGNNAKRLAEGKPLLPAVGGNDEVADLDLIFHYAAKLIEEAKRIRQEVTAMITHDLKTPLQTIRSFMEMVEHGVFGQIDEQGASLLRITQNSADHMFGLIDSVLQLEKLRTGNIQLNLVPTKLSEMLGHCLDSVRLLAEEKKISISSDFSESEAYLVDADVFWLEQVFVNILSNAIKFSQDGSSVRVTTRLAGEGINVRFSDWGPGIPPKDLKLIFNRFHRVKSTKSVSGTGLGLPIAKELIELHHGSISVDSKVGEGSTFTVHLPESAQADNKDNDGKLRLTESENSAPTNNYTTKESGKLTLLNKGLLLISIPLCFELTIFGALLNLQDQVEQEAQRLSHKRQLNDAANLVIRRLVSITEGVKGKEWQEFICGKKLPEIIADIKNSLKVMKPLSEGNERELKDIAIAETSFDTAISDLPRIKMKIDGRVFTRAEKAQITSKLEWHQARYMAPALFALEESGNMLDERPTIRIRERIRFLLKCALGLSILFAGGGALFYSKHLAERLRRLSENARRLGKGEPLLEQDTGTDEIAELDRNFHFASNLIEEAKRLRQEVTAMITHDLKTPLQSIRSLLEMLSLGMFIDLSGKGHELLSTAQSACVHMVDLIDSVLQLEKLRTRQLELKTEAIDLYPFLEKCIDTIKVIAEEKGIRIDNDFDKSVSLNINGDAFWLEEVFVNIFSNAVKFSPADSAIRISCNKSDGKVWISILDQGAGIPEADLKLVFQRFHRVKATESAAGTGLGLAIAKELIELHHGSISVESSVGEGSKFIVCLPLATGIAPDKTL